MDKKLKLRIKLKEILTNNVIVIYNEIFNKSNGIAWFEIDRKKYDLVSYDLYIGINDVNGKEIYTKDIVKHPLATEPEDLGWIIEYDNLEFKLRCVRLVNKEICKHSIDSSYLSKCQVIGNVDDNPNLLLTNN